MAKKEMDYIEKLIAPGNVDDWIDCTEIALDYGTFTKITLNRKGNEMRARYGADDITIGFRKKSDTEVSLTLSCTSEEVLNWYKACVADVALHPENYSDYYAGTPVSNAKDRQADGSVRPIPFWQKKWFMILMCVVLPPAGIFLFYKFHSATLFSRVIVTAVLIFYTLFVWMGFIGLNDGIDFSSIKEWMGDLKTATEQQVEEPVKDAAPAPTEEEPAYVGE